MPLSNFGHVKYLPRVIKTMGMLEYLLFLHKLYFIHIPNNNNTHPTLFIFDILFSRSNRY